jgi:soluble lytic murein transglycosylase-like protein
VKRVPILAVLALAGCSPRPAGAPPESQADVTLDRRVIWTAIQPMARDRGIDPGFVYAIVKLESNFDPHARRGDARGLMQLKPKTWSSVSDLPYEPAVWDWHANLEVGIKNLASIRDALRAKGVFSYPLMWAAYHYGLEFVEARGFDMSRIPRPSDPISRRLWSGEIHPVDPTR